MSSIDNSIPVTNFQLALTLERMMANMEGMAENINRLEGSIESLINGANGRPGVLERLTITEQATIGLGARLTAIEARQEQPSMAESTSRVKELMGMGAKPLMAVIALCVSLTTVIGKLITLIPGGSPVH